MNIKLHYFLKSSKESDNFNGIIANGKAPVIFLGFCITLMYEYLTLILQRLPSPEWKSL